MCIYMPHISHIVSYGGLQFLLSEIERQLVKALWWTRASGRRYQFIFDLTHPRNPCMKCRVKLEIDRHTGNYVPYELTEQMVANL